MKMNPLLLVVILLLVLSGPYVNAGPVGNFFKKVGQSISKPLQSQPSPRLRLSRRALNLRRRRTPRGDPLREQHLRPPRRHPESHNHHTPPKKKRLLALCGGFQPRIWKKQKLVCPTRIPVPGRKGMVSSPYLPEEDKYIDVTDFASGSVVKDPYTGKFFLVP